MHSDDDWHDVALVRRSLAGDGGARETLRRRYQRGLHTVACLMLGDAEAAREATRMALVRTQRTIHTRDPDDSFFHLAHRLLVECGAGCTPHGSGSASVRWHGRRA